MIEDSSELISPQLLPALTEASADLIQIGTLSCAVEQFAMDRASNQRSAFETELALERRVDDASTRVLAAVALARATATNQPRMVESGISTMLEDPLLSVEARTRFDALIGVSERGYAARLLALCDRIERDLQTATPEGDQFPPISGGDVTGCDLIALGAMLGGATCIVGCGPCCAVGVGGALLYVGACTS